MNTTAALTLVVGVVVMLGLALIPSRHRVARCVAVCGWAALFFDGEIANHWLDAIGILFFAGALAWMLRQDQLTRNRTP